MQTTETIIEFIKTNPKSNKASISEATGIKGLQLFNALKKMVTEGQLSIEGEGKEATYDLAVPEENVIIDEQPSAEETTEEATKEEKTEQPTTSEEQTDTEDKNEQPADKTVTYRNNDKFTFNGQEYGKGPLVRTLVAQYVADNPNTTLKKLKEVFPDDLMKRFGIFQDIDKAREISGKKYDRYFFKEEHQIKLKDKTVIVVCNQWTSENIKPFLEVIKKLGYDVK